MNTVVAFTPSQLIALILSICGGIVCINGAMIAILNWRSKLKEPENIQNSRIADLEERVKELEKGRRDNQNSIQKLEEDTRSFQKIMVKSLQALSEHALDESPETKKRLKDSVNELNSYLLDR